MYILLDLYSHLCSSIQLKTDWWRRRWEATTVSSGAFCLSTLTTLLDFLLSLTFIDIFLFNKTLDFFDKVVVTFCNLPRQNVGGRGCVTRKDQTTEDSLYRDPPPPQSLLFPSARIKRLSWGSVSGVGELSCFGVYSQCYFLN